jgi:hypothetical protein
MSFHETNIITKLFSDILLGFCEVAMYFVDFWYFAKMTAKFQFHLNIFKILKFQT